MPQSCYWCEVILTNDDPFCPNCGQFVSPEEGEEGTSEPRSPLATMAFVGRSFKLFGVLCILLLLGSGAAYITFSAVVRGEFTNAMVGGVFLLGITACVYAIYKAFVWARQQR